MIKKKNNEESKVAEKDISKKLDMIVYLLVQALRVKGSLDDDLKTKVIKSMFEHDYSQNKISKLMHADKRSVKKFLNK